MQIEAPPTERNTPKPDGERRGRVIAHTGDGKGKSTAAFSAGWAPAHADVALPPRRGPGPTLRKPIPRDRGAHDFDLSAAARLFSACSACKAAISWSAGKDSCLALLRAREAGLAVDTFLTMLDPDGLSKSHALPRELVQAQVALLGGQWQPAVAGPGEYAAVFAAQLQALRESGHTHLVFGDIDLQAHRDWLEPACMQAGLSAVFPLWGEARDAIAREVVSRGIRAMLVCVDTRWLDASFCGAEYDAGLLARLPAGVCPCGEDGEFHTFVWDAPGFSQPLRVRLATQRIVASRPPLSPTVLVFQDLDAA